MFDEARLPIEVLGVGEQLAAERAVAEMDDAPQLGAVVTGPVQDGVDIHHAVAGLELDLHPARERRAPVLPEFAVLLGRVQAAMTAGHDPQHVIVVQRDVPLYVARSIGQQVRLQASQRRLILRLDIAMPQIRPVVGHRIAHEKHRDWCRVGRAKRLAADAQRVLVQTELHRVGRRLVDPGLERQAWLLDLVSVVVWVLGIARQIACCRSTSVSKLARNSSNRSGGMTFFRITKPSSRNCSGSICIGSSLRHGQRCDGIARWKSPT